MRLRGGRRLPSDPASPWWFALSLLASIAWFYFARGLAFRLGLGDAAGGIGVAAAAVVGVTLWRWARADREASALAEDRCPACASTVRRWHDHARPGESSGLESWACDNCGYEHSKALTCEVCAA